MFPDSIAQAAPRKDDRIVTIMAAIFVILGGLAGVLLLGGLLLKALIKSSGFQPRATLLPW